MGENDIDDFIMNEEFKQKNNKTQVLTLEIKNECFDIIEEIDMSSL